MLAVIVIHALYDALFSITRLISPPLHENWGLGGGPHGLPGRAAAGRTKPGLNA